MKTEKAYWSSFWQVAITCLFVVLGRNPTWFTDTVRLVSPISNCLLTPDHAWQVPIAATDLADLFNEVPYFIYACLTAVVISAISLLGRKEANLVSILAAVSLSTAIKPLDIAPASAMLAIGWLDSSSWFQNRRSLQLTLITSMFLLSLLVTLEFGLVAIFLLFPLLREAKLTRTERNKPASGTWGAVIFVVALLVASFLRPGFSHALLRPFSWMWLFVPVELISDLSSPLLLQQYWFALAGLAVSSFLLYIFTRTESRLGSLKFLGLLCFCMIGLGCAQYLFLAGCGVVLLLSPVQFSRVRVSWFASLKKNRIVVVFLALAPAFALWQTDKVNVLAGESAVSMVDPTHWRSGGNVVLMDLSHSTDWQEESVSRQFTLILDDRWDLYGNHYPEYLAFCRDVKEVRGSSYLRTDMKWGGYKNTMRQWEASLLVIDSSQLNAIRGLSNSLDWKVMGIDGKRTIFGQSKVPQNGPQLNRAVENILFLEWPRQTTEINLEETIIANSDQDARTVAEVLCAIRLPYAAMRFIRGDSSPQAEKVRTRCYLELAHRNYRNSGEGSLLDQFRGVQRFREESQKGRWSQDERTRVLNSLEGLGLKVSGNKFEFKEDSEAATSIERIRKSLLTGDLQRANEDLKSLDSELRPYFTLLVQSHDLTSNEILDSLQEVLKKDQQLPQPLRGEAYFYLGCIALETGETVVAIEAFLKSKELTPTSPFQAIRDFNLGQLRR